MSQLSRYKRFIGLLVTGALPFIAQPAWSSGFALSEQNASGLGNAYAGATSIAEDASTAYYNVAGLTRLGEEQIAGSVVGISSHGNVKANTAATATFPKSIQAGTPVSIGPGNASSEVVAAVPALHYSKKISDCWVFGLSITSPFGLKTRYHNDSIARYTATRSNVQTINIGPGIAYSFQNGLSLGVGADAMYVIAKLDTRIGTGNSNTDGFLENTASDWGIGYHAGILYEFSDSTRVGLNYRSKVKVKPKGESVIQFLAASLPETRLSVRSKVTLPETVNLGIYHDFNDTIAAMVDVQWTHWSSFKHLTLRYPDEGSSLIFNQNFKNTIRVSLGATYQWCEEWKLRLGTAFDRSPAQDKWRSIRIPDTNRIWAAIGAQYQFTKCLALDVGYAHVFFKEGRLNEVAPTLGSRGSINRVQGLQTFNGKSRGRADLIGIQLTWDLV